MKSELDDQVLKVVPDPYKSEDQLQEHKEQAEEYLNSAKDKVVGESPYNNYEVQPIEFVLENEDVLHPTDAFLLNNVLKYICRHRDKGGKEDLDKAIHYLRLVKQHTYDS